MRFEAKRLNDLPGRHTDNRVHIKDMRLGELLCGRPVWAGCTVDELVTCAKCRTKAKELLDQLAAVLGQGDVPCQ